MVSFALYSRPLIIFFFFVFLGYFLLVPIGCIHYLCAQVEGDQAERQVAWSCDGGSCAEESCAERTNGGKKSTPVLVLTSNRGYSLNRFGSVSDRTPQGTEMARERERERGKTVALFYVWVFKRFCPHTHTHICCLSMRSNLSKVRLTNADYDWFLNKLNRQWITVAILQRPNRLQYPALLQAVVAVISGPCD